MTKPWKWKKNKMESGEKIRVVNTKKESPAVDTPADLKNILALLRTGKIES